MDGKFAFPQGIFEGQVAMDGSKITAVKKSGLVGKKIHPMGIIFPGFIDPHVHLREPGWVHKEDFRTGSKAALHGGVTCVIDMPNNKVPAKTAKAIKAKAKLAKKKALIDIRFYGMVDGNRKELIEMAPLVAGYKVYMSETTGTQGVRKEELLTLLRGLPKKLVSFHCEDKGIVESDSLRPSIAEVKAIKDAIVISKKLNLASNICHLSTMEGFYAINRGYCEASPLHAFFSSGAKNKLLTMNPPLRGKKDRNFIFNALLKGKIDFLATDHAPHTLEEKREGAKGCPGLDTYGAFVSLLLKRGCSLRTAIGITSANISNAIGMKKGHIEPGYGADFTVMEIKPTKIHKRDLQTKCQWSPFEGKTFPGRVSMTIAGGEIAFQDNV